MPPQSTLGQAASALGAGRFDQAQQLFGAVLAGDPDDFDALHGLGIVLLQGGDAAGALALFDRAARQNGGISQLHNNRANALRALGRDEAALAAFGQALALSPGDAVLHLNRGNALLALDRLEAARADFARAAALDETLLLAWQNKAAAETRLGLYGAALATCDRLIALCPERAGAPPSPELVKAHWNAAAICLTFGDYARGWRDYEWRWADGPFRDQHRAFAGPPWRGEPIAGRTIVLHAEQGFGDAIQFCRYAPMVAARGARVMVEAPAPLLPLFCTLEGVSVLVSRDEAVPPYQAHCPMMSLPLAFGTTVDTVPARVPYLAADPARVAAWRQRLEPARGRRRVGLAWSGLARFGSDAMRSAPLAELAGLIRPGLDYVAVQKDVRPADREAAARLGVALHGEAINDFADAAALSALMDVVVSVDSAPAHLAGALGQTVWVMLPHLAEWRWGWDRSDSPWYPTARLFRQETPGGWAGLARRVGDALAAL